MINFSVPDVLGLYEDEAVKILKQHGFVVTSVGITKSTKGGQPEGGCRVVRQRTSGQEVELILSFQKWVCS
ncbi:MAG: PASTA domain-containing protein [Bacillota bacterium]|jgi:beta-lactam-binding protein with PASTA domain